ncbi:MAG: hypothetical protein JOZ38_10585 [Candidatus Eremiobacteraeota bacterium]|nr:hypothetical protein [Candidatus Eremiobacteraeota bacterium]
MKALKIPSVPAADASPLVQMAVIAAALREQIHVLNRVRTELEDVVLAPAAPQARLAA